MKIEKLIIPEKLFGMETGLLVLFVPLVLVILLVIVSVNLVIIPKVGDFQQMMTQSGDLESQRQQLVQKRNYLLTTDQSQLSKNADSINKSLLPQKNAYLLVGMVGQIMANYGYQIDSFMISPGDISKGNSTSPTKGTVGIPIALSVAGPMSSYLDLIKGLESSLPILSLDSLKMQDDGDVARVDLTISAYYAGGGPTVDISKLTLSDLALSKDESDLIAKLGQFTVLGNIANLESGFNTNKSFVKYDRTDPFNP